MTGTSSRRRWRLIGGALLMFMGGIWFLQGINVLTVGNSPMIGDRRWAYYGAAAAAVGLAVIITARSRRR